MQFIVEIKNEREEYHEIETFAFSVYAAVSGYAGTAAASALAAGLWNASGTAWFDCFQFESGVSPNAYNILENRAFAVGIIYDDGTGEPCYNPDVDQWQTMSFTAAPKKENWGRVIDHVNIYVIY